MKETIRFWAIVTAWAAYAVLVSWSVRNVRVAEETFDPPLFIPFTLGLALACLAGWMHGRHQKYSKGFALLISVVLLPLAARMYERVCRYGSGQFLYDLEHGFSWDVLVVIAIFSAPFVIGVLVGRRVCAKHSVSK